MLACKWYGGYIFTPCIHGYSITEKACDISDGAQGNLPSKCCSIFSDYVKLQLKTPLVPADHKEHVEQLGDFGGLVVFYVLSCHLNCISIP